MPVVLSVFGTRPEAVKMAPLVKALSARDDLVAMVAVTAQHRQMLDQVLDLFRIKPDYDLDLMRPGQHLEDLTGRVLSHLVPVLEDCSPDLVLVQGDTTTAFAAALGAFYRKVPVGHVEAGLRTYDIYNPFPEEMNRRLITQLATLHFAPTPTAAAACRQGGVAQECIYLTGNTVIDALLDVAARSTADRGGGDRGRTILVTAHRRENWGEPMEQIFLAVRDLVDARADLRAVIPVHLNPVVQQLAQRLLGDHPRVDLIKPLDYEPFVRAMQEAQLILTDSGGVQEEAPSLGKPVLVLRTTTERPEAVEAGTVRLVGVRREDILAEALRLLDDPAAYERMANAVNPYGDGRASERIVEAIRHHLGLRPDRPLEAFAPPSRQHAPSG
ncbi:MAG: UDP-N-acetylglucosamine 2-epimerase (non-hydrolyzing) [Candidatus Sericytochromatia bacterium]|nr:UDP-N-acetylglucosamine 2-epimerase (non-hydrolyzing) [Candidatus Tanganyikabacteria bacterium]